MPVSVQIAVQIAHTPPFDPGLLRSYISSLTHADYHNMNNIIRLQHFTAAACRHCLTSADLFMLSISTSLGGHGVTSSVPQGLGACRDGTQGVKGMGKYPHPPIASNVQE